MDLPGGRRDQLSGSARGRVEIPGTAISQPIVQASEHDPEYYLTHDVYKEWNYSGCPYLDAGCKLGIDSWAATVFGHNITTPPAMFHDLERYHDSRFAASHGEVVIYTPTETKRFHVVASRTIDGSVECKRVDFDNARDFRKWRSETLAAAGAPDVNDSPGQLLTLCSCSYFVNPANERTLVYAVEENRAKRSLGQTVTR